MAAEPDIDALRRERSSWWYVARRSLLREAVQQSLSGKREARVLDFGCSAELEFADSFLLRATSAHDSLAVLAFQKSEGHQSLVCTNADELAFSSNSFDTIVAGDMLQSATDDGAVLRELRRVLKDGGMLCLTVPAYSFLWGEEDEIRGHQRRYSASELRRKLNNSGFEIERVSYLVASGFLPAAMARLMKDIFRKSVVRNLEASALPRWANGALVAMVNLERQLIRVINLPFGTRLVCWARKPPLVAERVTISAWERQWARPPLPQGM